MPKADLLQLQHSAVEPRSKTNTALPESTATLLSFGTALQPAREFMRPNEAEETPENDRFRICQPAIAFEGPEMAAAVAVGESELQ